MRCYVCDNDITPELETDEHIIINAAGGRLKSNRLICVKCNQSFGQTIDAALAKQLNNMANMLEVKRHHGKPQPIATTGKSSQDSYRLDVGGKAVLTNPSVKKTTDGERILYSIQARSEDELKEILKGIARKYPQFDVKEAMQQAKWQRNYLSEPLEVSVELGGEVVFKAVCKCAVNFYIFNGGDPNQIKHLIPYIQGRESKPVVWMHYTDHVYELSTDESFHVLHLVGNPIAKTLYCYVDYFNTYKYLVLLSDSYAGNEIRATYCFDVLNVKPIDKKVTLQYDRDLLLDFFLNKKFTSFDKVQQAFNHTLSIALYRQSIRHQNEIVERAMQNALGKYPAGTRMTEEMLDEVAGLVAREIAPFIVHQQQRIKRSHES